MKKYVFISYKSEEADIAYEMKKQLEENGIDCWMAPESIPYGAEYDEKLADAVEGCCGFVIMLSPRAQESKWIKKEISMAFDTNKMIFPYLVEECNLKGSFKIYLTNNQIFSPDRSQKDSSAQDFIRVIKSYIADNETVDENNKNRETDSERGKKLATLITYYNDGIKNMTSNPALAEDSLLKAIDFAENNKGLMNSAVDCYKKLAYFYKAKENFADAHKYYEICISKCNILKSSNPEHYDETMADVHLQNGCTYYDEKCVNEAILELNRSLEIYTSFKNTTKHAHKLAEVYLKLVDIYGNFGIYNDAFRFIQLSEELYKRLICMKSSKYGLDLALLYSKAADLHKKSGNKDEARKAFIKSKEVFEKMFEETSDEGYKPYISAIEKAIANI